MGFFNRTSSTSSPGRTSRDPRETVIEQIAILRAEHERDEVERRGLQNRPRYRSAIATLNKMGAAGVTPLLEALDRDCDGTRGEQGDPTKIGLFNDVVEVLGKIGDPRAVEPLARRLGQGSGVSLALAGLPGGRQALLDAIGDEDAAVEWDAMQGLGQTHSRDPAVAAALLVVLRDGQFHSRYKAAAALGDLGCRDRNVIEALAAIIRDKDEDEYVQRDAQKALERLRG